MARATRQRQPEGYIRSSSRPRRFGSFLPPQSTSLNQRIPHLTPSYPNDRRQSTSVTRKTHHTLVPLTVFRLQMTLKLHYYHYPPINQATMMFDGRPVVRRPGAYIDASKVNYPVVTEEVIEVRAITPVQCSNTKSPSTAGQTNGVRQLGGSA